ncbi:MAG TPA: CBS domain-containing protein [Anaerolineaceae bacterium]|nr:CBS domain-containing protein [Anaerolineaceae bacterium]
MYRVKDILALKGADIYHVTPDAPTIDALRLLDEKDVGALLVIEAGKLVGIISERDIVRSIAHSGQLYLYTPVSEYMTREVITAQPDDTVDQCMQIMSESRIRHLPVMTAGGALVGVISIGDVMKQFISHQESTITSLENYIEGRDYMR